MREFLSFDLSFFSSRTSENARTSDLENERQNLSLIQKNRRRRQKFCSKNKFRSIKNSKKSKRILQNRENNEKILRRRRSPLGRNSTHHFVVLIYYSPLSLKIKCSRLREEGLPLRNEEDIEAFSEVVLSPLKKKQTTF